MMIIIIIIITVSVVKIIKFMFIKINNDNNNDSNKSYEVQNPFIYYRNEFYICEIYRCVNSDVSQTEFGRN